jgi:hypothetical protein
MDEDTAAPSETVLAAWPTPNTPNGGRSSPQMSATGVMPNGTKRQAGLEHVARLAGWPTPMAGSKATEDYNEAGNTDSSRRTVELCGWQTPKASDGAPPRDPEKRLKTDRQTRTPGMPGNYKLDLSDQVALVGWATPRAEDAESAGMRHSRGVADTLTAQAGQGVPLAGWQTPKLPSGGPCKRRTPGGGLRKLEDQADGAISTSCPAGTGRRGVLRPGHSRWLMGYPAAWDSCGATAMQSCRRSPRRS